MTQAENEQPNSKDRRAGFLLGFLIGIALAVSLGAALDSYPIGIGVGTGVGVSLGVAFSGQRREPSKPLTIIGIVLLVVGVALLVVILSLVRPQWWCGYPVLNLLPGC